VLYLAYRVQHRGRGKTAPFELSPKSSCASCRKPDHASHLDLSGVDRRSGHGYLQRRDKIHKCATPAFLQRACKRQADTASRSNGSWALGLGGVQGGRWIVVTRELAALSDSEQHDLVGKSRAKRSASLRSERRERGWPPCAREIACQHLATLAEVPFLRVSSASDVFVLRGTPRCVTLGRL